MSGLPGLTKVLSVLSAALVLTGCGLGPVGTTHRPTPAVPFDSRRIILELNQAWFRTGPDSGAYRNVFNLESPPSLYETSWHLRVASAIGISIRNVSAEEVDGWIDPVFADPASVPGSRLQAIYLAIGALHGLGRPIPTAALTGIDELRAGDLYKWTAKEPPSWNATALAVIALTEAGGKPPSGLADLVRRALPAATSAQGPNGWFDQLIPVWTVADLILPPGDREGLRQGLSAALSTFRGEIVGKPLGEQTVFLMSQVNTIARANGVTGLDLPPSALTGLATSFGYLTRSSNDPTPSMFSTYFAIEAGYAPSGSQSRQALASYLQWSAAPKGWREDFTPPGPVASFYAWEVSKALGETGAEASLRVQVAAWLDEVAKAATWTPGSAAHELYILVLLGKSLGIAVPQGLTNMIRAELQATDDHLAATDLVSLARLSSALGIPAGDNIKDRWRASERDFDLSLTRQVQAAFTIAEALGDRDFESNLKSHISALHTGPLWVGRAGAPSPDLQATATGALVLGRTPAVAAAVNATFADQRGFWLLPPANKPGNVVDLRTLYLGLWLTNAPVDSGGAL